jgi:hypothetical protein
MEELKKTINASRELLELCSKLDPASISEKKLLENAIFTILGKFILQTYNTAI